MLEAYNERLFNKKSIRSKLHYARYFWLSKKIEEYCPDAKTVLELGCFDAKTIDFLPKDILRYDGYDANWEGGIQLAIDKYKVNDNYSFIISDTLDAFSPSKEAFDISISMETLEHLPVAQLDGYIEKLYKSTKHLCFVTVPNEKGILLIAKYLVKKLILRHVPESYSLKELFYGFFGKMTKIQRNEGLHKGFDYLELIQRLNKKFIVEEVSGIPLSWLPLRLNFTIGIILRKENKA